jgi:hypothetical protein
MGDDMGMVLVLRRVDAVQLAVLRADPDTVAEFAIEDEEAQENGDCIDFDKAWHGLHFLFTGSADQTNAPLSLLRTDSEPLGEDIGYGPVQYLSPATVAVFCNALAQLTDADLRARFDPDAMTRADVYLADVLSEQDDWSWTYMMQSIPALRTLVDRCVAKQSGLLAVIT